jgi:hypothetical protein
LVAVSSLLFYRLRTKAGLDQGFGTELFALLLAVDGAIVLGAVDVSTLLTDQAVQRFTLVLALVLAVSSILAAMLAIDFEVTARAAWMEYEQHEARWSLHERINFLREFWLRPYLSAWTIRTMASTIHLAWIVRIPKWMVA